MKKIYLFSIIFLIAQHASSQCSTNVVATPEPCYGNCNGSVSLTPMSGTPPYSLTINGLPVSPFASSYVMSNACAGSYYWVLTDSLSSCSDSGVANVTEFPQLSTMISSFADVWCNGGSNGWASVTVLGGVPPYSYSWAPSGGTGDTATGLSAGNYTVAVTDANFCIASANVTISQPQPLIMTTTGTNVICFGDSTGTAQAFVSGGVGFYYFTWSPVGGHGPVASNLSAGSYTVTVMDTNGCIQTGSVAITQPSQPVLNVSSITDASCFGSSNGSACVNASGGTPGYSYSWSPGGNVLPCATNLVAGNYTCIVTDANGCTASETLLIDEPAPVTATVSSIAPSCGQCDGIVNIVASGGMPSYNFIWTPPVFAGICENIMYQLNVVDINGCTDSFAIFYPAQCDSVWPGDANFDGVADNQDVLSIGITYGSIGPVRAGAVNSWTGQVCANWSDTLASGVNNKHSDCDGNGTVDASDTLAVSLNYGRIHPRLLTPGYNSLVPDLSLDVTADSAGLNQLLHIKIHLGSAAVPAVSIYGMAFTLSFDPSLLDTSTASFDFSSSALGTTGVNLLSFQHPDYSAGIIELALTRTDHTDATGIDSIIGEFEVRVSNAVSSVSILHFDISDVKAITQSESDVALNTLGDSVVINPSIVGIQHAEHLNRISVFPSPVNDKMYVNSPYEVKTADLLNELGEKIFSVEINRKSFEVRTDGIKSGMYFLQLTTEYGMIRQRICVMK